MEAHIEGVPELRALPHDARRLNPDNASYEREASLGMPDSLSLVEAG